MNNPWKDISLSDYENHMAMDSVQQLQAMNQMMKGQLNQYEVQSAMILGIAGDNGLEHVDTEKLNKVYGVDINQECFIHISNTKDSTHFVKYGNAWFSKISLPVGYGFIGNGDAFLCQFISEILLEQA